MNQVYAQRRNKLMNILGEGILLLNGAGLQTRNHDVHFPFRQDSDFYYLTGFNEPDSYLILKRSAHVIESILVLPPKDKVKEIWEGKRLGVEGAVSELGFDRAYSNEDLIEALEEELKDQNILYYEFSRDTQIDSILLEALDSFRHKGRTNPLFPQTIVGYGQTLGEMRHIKSELEIGLMKKAAQITRDANLKVMKCLRPGMYEYEIQALLEYEYRRYGCDAGYGSIVAGGANAAILHYTNNDAPLKDGDLLLIDSGCEYQSYCSDVTRCYPTNGRFSNRQKAVYEIVLEANKKAIEQCKIGNTLKDVHQAALEVLAKGLVDLKLNTGSLEAQLKDGSLGRYYMHNTSHWLGMDVHDVGLYDVGGEPIPFEEGMVFTVEPGLYFNPDFHGGVTEFDGIGIRIEDDILVTVDGPENLSHEIPKEVSQIEEIMSGEN